MRAEEFNLTKTNERKLEDLQNTTCSVSTSASSMNSLNTQKFETTSTLRVCLFLSMLMFNPPLYIHLLTHMGFKNTFLINFGYS